MVIVRLQKIEKIKFSLILDCIRHKWCKIKQLTFMCKVHLFCEGISCYQEKHRYSYFI